MHSLTGPVKVNTVSGEVELADLTGDLHLTTVSGKVSGRSICGPVHLNTVSGQVALDESNLSSVDATTVSGRMEYQTAFGAGPYRFNSVSGDVELLVPPETHCSAELHAVSGKLFTKLPATSMRGKTATRPPRSRAVASRYTCTVYQGICRWFPERILEQFFSNLHRSSPFHASGDDLCY